MCLLCTLDLWQGKYSLFMILNCKLPIIPCVLRVWFYVFDRRPSCRYICIFCKIRSIDPNKADKLLFLGN